MHAGGTGAGAVPVIPWHRRGSTGWWLMLVAVLVWDLSAPDEHTLSESFRKSMDHPVKAVVVAAGWAALTAHLYNVIPKRADPLHVIHVARDKHRGARHAVAP